MATKVIRHNDVNQFRCDLTVLFHVEKRMEEWYDKLPRQQKEKLSNLYISFKNNLSTASADLSALFSYLVVNVANDIATQKEEGKA